MEAEIYAQKVMEKLIHNIDITKWVRNGDGFSTGGDKVKEGDTFINTTKIVILENRVIVTKGGICALDHTPNPMKDKKTFFMIGFIYSLLEENRQKEVADTKEEILKTLI